MHGMSERSYSSISNHKEGESRPLVGPDNAASVQENAQVRGTILHDCRRPSYQQDTNLKRPLDTGSSVTNDVSNSSSHSSLSLQYPHTEMVDPPPIPKNTPRTDNSSNGRKRIGESISTTRAPASSLSRTNEGRISYSAPKKNPKSFRSHLSYTMTSGDDSFDENSQESLPDYSYGQNRGLKRGLLLFTVIFVLGTIVHRNFYSDGSGSENNTNTVNNGDTESLANHEAIMALKNISSVSNVANGAVASDTEICSEMGLSIMRDFDGNAVDAAVTTVLCLGLVNPASSGIGGGAFILIHSTPREEDSESKGRSTPFTDRRKRPDASQNASKPNKVTEVIDCRETAPGNATYDMFEKFPPSVSMTGALAIAVPGELRGLELAHERFGRLNWEQVLQPVIDLAENGVPVTSHLEKEIFDNTNRIDQFPSTKQILTKNNDGKNYLVNGQNMTRSSYAHTLKNVAIYGADYIYKGEVAAQIAQEIQAAGGIISSQDIENYKPVLRDPLIAEVDGFTVVRIPPPSSGGATIVGALRFLSGYMIPYATFADTLSVHRLVEAFKHVFAIRMSLSDPDFFSNETEAAVKDLVSGPLMETLRTKTSDTDVLPLSQYGGRWALLHDSDDKNDAKDAHEGDRKLKKVLRQSHRRTRLFNYLEDHGTTSFSVVDRDRNCVSITSTVNYYFGSVYASPSTGIIFNDQMDDFATPGRPNKYGKKRVFS